MIAPAKDNTDQWPEAVIGIRVSTDKQDATAHEHRARDWCESNHYRIVATYGKLHEGESGGDDVDEREMGLALKDAIRRGCLLVVDAQDRLSRVVPDLYAMCAAAARQTAPRSRSGYRCAQQSTICPPMEPPTTASRRSMPR